MEKLYEIIFVISIFLFFFFALFLFNNKKGDKLSNSLFAFFCLANAFIIIPDLMYLNRDIVYQLIPAYFDVILDSSLFLTGPLIYFYSLSNVEKEVKLNKNHFLHLIPALLDFIIRNIFFFNSDKNEFINDYYLNFNEAMTRYLLADLSMLIYLISSLIIYYKFKLKLKDYYADYERIKLSWLFILLIGFSFVVLFSISKHLIVIFYPGGTVHNIFGIGMHISSLVFITIVVFQGLKKPEIFYDLDYDSLKPKYEKTALPENVMQDLLKKIISEIKIHKLYLDPNLNLSNLSKRISIPSHQITQVINRTLNKNFYQLVNEFRIEEFKRIINDDLTKSKTILEVLYESGFKSKSTFNRIFKQFTGLTPTEFINKNDKKIDSPL